MTDQLHCPKCGGHSWLEQVDHGIVQRCLCGLFKFVHRQVDGIEILTRVVRKDQVYLPQEGTKLSRTLLGLNYHHPRAVSTSTIAAQGGLQPKETSALLVMLLARGLVERVEGRRGLVGGSIWKLTPKAIELL